jgi:uracil-DNA glycosylase
MTAHEPISAYCGPPNPKLLLVGEAFGGNEADIRKPFVGEAGKELFRILGEAMPDLEPELHCQIQELFKYGPAWAKRREDWLAAASIGLTNVFNLRPANNDISQLFETKKESAASPDYDLPLYRISGSPGKSCLKPEFRAEISRLMAEIERYRPNLIVALGNTASWAVAGVSGISTIRGTLCLAKGTSSPCKVLPTYHPAGILRNWSWRSIVVADLIKARREMEFSEIIRPARKILINPTLVELEDWVQWTLAHPPSLLSCDIETAYSQITCIGFARSKSEAVVIPFLNKTNPGWHYWLDSSGELYAWDLVAKLLASPIPKLGQNFVYDLQYLLRMGLRVNAYHHDTMLLHHSLFPELQKGLGFLGSIYTSEPAWKLMRHFKPDTEKRDE